MIVAAAIYHDGQVYALPAPARHHDVIHFMCKKRGFACVPGTAVQGFIDSRCGFVGRVQARDIAVHLERQIEDAQHPTELFSEDLW